MLVFNIGKSAPVYLSATNGPTAETVIAAILYPHPLRAPVEPSELLRQYLTWTQFLQRLENNPAESVGS